MLVGIVQLGNDSEGVSVLPSWVRLKRLELCPQLLWNAEQVPALFLFEGVWRVEDRELIDGEASTANRAHG